MENPLEQKLDGFQSEVGQQFDSLQCSFSKLAQQLDHQGEENPEEVCLSDTMVEDHCLQQLQKGLVENFESSGIGAAICLWEKKEAIPLLLTEEAVEEHQDHNLPLPPTGSVYILPSPAPQSKPNSPFLTSLKSFIQRKLILVFDPTPLYCNSFTTAVGGIWDTNIVDSRSPYCGKNQIAPLPRMVPNYR